MEFLNPTALYGLLALPLLLIPYLIRRKPQRVVFSSLLLFADTGISARARPWGRLRLPPIFFLQLLLLALLILALGEPVFSVHPTRIAIFLDNSASMQTLENGKSRFALAKEKARGILTGLSVAGKVDLYLTVPKLERVRGMTFSPDEAAGVVSGLEPYDLGDTPTDYNNTLGQMAREHEYERVYLITDHPARGQAGLLRVITVGEPAGNLALTSFQVSRSSLLDLRLKATAEVANFSSKDERIKVLLRGSGALLASRELMVAAGKSAPATFEGFPLHTYYEMELNGRDALPLDNRRFAVPSESRNLRILGISPRPQALASLRSIPGVALDIIAPEDYAKGDRADYHLEIFHFASPAVLPQSSALFVLPPDNNSLANLEKPISRPVISSWREPHGLTRYVNFALFRPAYARPLKPQAAGTSIMESPQGSLAFAAERQNGRYLVLGFDPFPYLGRENLPVSIFTLNLLDWFCENAGGRRKATGEPLVLDAARQGGWVITPTGERISLKPGSRAFGDTFMQGIYQWNRDGEKELFAVNLQDTGESDLRAPSAIEIRVENGSQSSASTFFSFWPYLLLASLLLLLIEWFIQGRTFRFALRPTSNPSRL